MASRTTSPDNLRVAYVMLWFPLSSETFVFREVENLRKLGVDARAFTMYGRASKGLAREMAEYKGPVSRMGIRAIAPICAAFARACKKNPGLVWRLMRKGLLRKMRNLEAQAENAWCFFAGFLLAERCQKDGVNLIHSAWANGPATAAWVASQISGIPFAFTGRAGDIYPQDGILPEKIADALFARANNAANVGWLRKFCPPGQEGKVKLVYNSLTLPEQRQHPPAKPSQPARILAVGRFARTKGFPELLTAIARLKRENFPVVLTLIGDGRWRSKLVAMRGRLRLNDCVIMPGFIPNDQIAERMRQSDLLVVPSVVHANGDRDGIPNVIMEACSLGLPVVATDVCGIPEIIKNGATGYLVGQRDPATLASAIREALERPDRMAAYAAQARALVKNTFDPEANTAALRDLYLEALQSRQAAHA